MSQGAILDRALESAWLDLALELAREGGETARRRLDFELRDRIAAPEGRKKTVRVLARIWLTPPDWARPMIAWGIERSPRVADSRLLHLGALFATHPFFGEVCAAVGRELTLHGQVRLAAVRQHLRRRWGDREIVDVSARGCIRTLRSLDLLRGTPGGRTLSRGTGVKVPPELAPWMYHALMLTRQTTETDLETIPSAPEFFMLSLPRSQARGYPFLERVNEGGGRTVLRLVIPKPGKPPTTTPAQSPLFDARGLRARDAREATSRRSNTGSDERP